jgi:hypothetical protein
MQLHLVTLVCVQSHMLWPHVKYQKRIARQSRRPLVSSFLLVHGAVTPYIGVLKRVLLVHRLE